jgi:hypothetical protein
MTYAIENYTLEQTIHLIQMMGDVGFLTDKENIPKLKLAAEFFLEKVIEKSKEPLPLIDRLVYVCKGYKESIQEEVVKTVIQLVNDLQTEHFTTPAVTKKLLGFYRKIKAQSTLAAFAPLTKALTEKIVLDMSHRGYPQPEHTLPVNFHYLTFTDPQYVQINTVVASKECILLAKEFFYAYRETGNEGYKEIAIKAFDSLPLNKLSESHLICFVEMLRRGSEQERRKAKSLLKIEKTDISNMQDMKRMLYADILYRDENNPKQAVEHIRDALKTCRYWGDTLVYTSVELYYLFKSNPLPVDDIKKSIERFPATSSYKFYYKYLLDIQTNVMRMPTKEELEKFRSMAYSVRLCSEFDSAPANIMILRLLKELPQIVKTRVYEGSEKW